MKRTFLILLTVTVLLCLFSCESSVFDDVTAQLDELSWNSSALYDESQISQIEKSIKSNGIEIKGSVKNISHYIRGIQGSSTWVYVYEFEFAEDATSFYEQYAQNWGNARIKENVVFYGNIKSIIDSIEL